MRWLCFLLGFMAWASCKRTNSYEDLMVFRYNESEGISSLDPAYSRNLENIWACQMLYNGLVQTDDSLRIWPSIAKGWEVDSNGTQYTFFLRRDVRFHDHEVFPEGKGRRVISDDFVFSFQRLLDPKVASPGAWVFANVDPDSAFVAPNDSTLIIKLSKPFPPFLGLLTMPYCSVVPHELITSYGDDFRRNPVGTGPFKFHFWIENTRLVLLKHQHYFEKDDIGNALPYLDAVSVSFIPDKSAAYLDLLKGNFDFMSGLHTSYKDELLTAEGFLNPLYADRLYLQRQAFLKTDYLGFVVKADSAAANPWRSKDLRRALNYAIDREAMVRYLRNNVYAPATGGFIPQGMPGHSAKNGYSYQPDSVIHLLTKAGYKGGEGLPPITLSTTSDYVDLCEYVQHQAAQFGIKVKVEVLPASVHRERTARGELELFRKSWLADYPDDENFMALFFSENITPKGPNYFFYADANFDQLYKEALSITDPKLRANLYREMDSLMMRDSPVIPLYYDVVIRFVSHRVSGLDRNPMNVLDLRRVKVDRP